MQKPGSKRVQSESTQSPLSTSTSNAHDKSNMGAQLLMKRQNNEVTSVVDDILKNTSVKSPSKLNVSSSKPISDVQQAQQDLRRSGAFMRIRSQRFIKMTPEQIEEQAKSTASGSSTSSTSTSSSTSSTAASGHGPELKSFSTASSASIGSSGSTRGLPPSVLSSLADAKKSDEAPLRKSIDRKVRAELSRQVSIKSMAGGMNRQSRMTGK